MNYKIISVAYVDNSNEFCILFYQYRYSFSEFGASYCSFSKIWCRIFIHDISRARLCLVITELLQNVLRHATSHMQFILSPCIFFSNYTIIRLYRESKQLAISDCYRYRQKGLENSFRSIRSCTASYNNRQTMVSISFSSFAIYLFARLRLTYVVFFSSRGLSDEAHCRKSYSPTRLVT